MSTPTKPRKRAVRLTPEALAALQAALAQRWQDDARDGRLTRETRAELMGVSVTTAGRILSGGGVDRATLALAFKTVGLPWSDSCCEHATEEGDVEKPEVAAQTPTELPPTPGGGPRKRGFVEAYAFGACVLAVVAALALSPRTSAPSHPPVDEAAKWGNVFNSYLYDGIARYHRADYAGCRRDLQQAHALAEKHDSAIHLALVIHTEGDLAQEQGRLQEAKTNYQAELTVRSRLIDPRPKPGIYESLGEVETRLGEYRSAANDLRLALDDFRRLRDPVGIAIVTGDLGSVAFGDGRLDEADALFRQSLALLGSLSKPDIVWDVQGRRALVLLKRGRADEARRTLASCLDYWTKKGHPRWIAVSELQLAMADEQLGDRSAAVARLARSRAAFESVGDRARLAEATERLRRLSSKA